MEQTSGTDPEDVEELNLESWKGASISVQEKKLLETYLNLDYFSLSDCGLKNLDNFPVLPKLIKLDLNKNDIKGGLDKLSPLKELMQLELSNNQLGTVADFLPLVSLTSLVSLDLKNCPVTLTEDYRQSIFKIIPSLQVIDGMDREGKEISLFSDDEDDDDLIGGDDDDDDDDDEEEFDDSEEEEEEEDESSESVEVPKKRSRGPNGHDNLGKKN